MSKDKYLNIFINVINKGFGVMDVANMDRIYILHHKYGKPYYHIYSSEYALKMPVERKFVVKILLGTKSMEEREFYIEYILKNRNHKSLCNVSYYFMLNYNYSILCYNKFIFNRAIKYNIYKIV